ncbi:hypothetical protein Dimus_006121, partial [Dionaea muscipula]
VGNAASIRLPRAGRSDSGLAQQISPKVGKPYLAKPSYATVVSKGMVQQKEVPTIRVHTIGNGWLYVCSSIAC